MDIVKKLQTRRLKRVLISIYKASAHNKNYMSIGVSVWTTKSAARNNGGASRRESIPQSPTAYSFERWR